MKISKRGVLLNAHYEQLHDGDLSEIGLQPKMDPSSIWTVGLGHALKNPETGKWLKGEKEFQLISKFYPQYLNMTKEDAYNLFDEDIDEVENQINNTLFNLKQNEFDALCSFVYNCGIGNFLSSTLLERINMEFRSDELIRDAFLMWRYSDGKELKGLIARRKSEANLFCKNELRFYN